MKLHEESYKNLGFSETFTQGALTLPEQYTDSLLGYIAARSSGGEQISKYVIDRYARGACQVLRDIVKDAAGKSWTLATFTTRNELLSGPRLTHAEEDAFRKILITAVAPVVAQTATDADQNHSLSPVNFALLPLAVSVHNAVRTTLLTQHPKQEPVHTLPKDHILPDAHPLKTRVTTAPKILKADNRNWEKRNPRQR